VDFHPDHTLRCNTDPKYKHLYKWAINDIDAQGHQISLDQIPWVWSLYFTATSCVLGESVEIESQFHSDETTPKPSGFTTRSYQQFSLVES